jgi:putative aldouronate transport system substrate-binding protein
MFLAVSAGTFAAGRGQSGGNTAGLTTLQVFSKPANVSGIQESTYWTEILKEDLGIVIELLPAGNQADQQLQAMMASRRFPDIVIFHEYREVIEAIQAGLILNMDDYKDKLSNVYRNIPNAIQYMRDNISNGTSGLYAVPNNTTTRSQQVGNLNYGPYLRWDYYKELGMPVISELEDYLPVLKRMMDAHPVNENGQKVYGLSLWNDWDYLYMGIPTYLCTYLSGYKILADDRSFVEANLLDNSMRSILDDDSTYKRGVKLYFTANQMGLLDPDSLSQTWNEVVEKATAGRLLLSIWPWGTGSFRTVERDAAGVGYRFVPFQNEKQYSTGAPNYIGTSWCWAIGKDTKNLDKVLAYVDYMFSYDGVWNMANGRQGVKWDVDENGEPYLTQLGWDLFNDTREFPNGGRNNDGLGVVNSYGVHTRNIHPVYKRQIDTLDWIKKDFAPPDTNLVADWKVRMNAQDDLEYMIQHDMVVNPPFAPMEPAPENIQQINVRVGDVVKTMSWQAVFAKDEAEFNSIWNEMVTRAKGMGLDTSVQWYVDAYRKALSAGAKYMN